MNNNPRLQVLARNIPRAFKPTVIFELFKLRLTSLVVFSSILGYLIGLQVFNLVGFLSLVFGGFLVTGASNTMNQIIEREQDMKMDRTSGRPIPTGRIGVKEAWMVGSLTGCVGIAILWFLVNPLTGILAGLSLFIYVVLYTPMKKISGFSVFVGAFPGAIPPMLGWVAATGSFGLEAGLLFAMQFMWQFPHFWAIAWCVNDDYNKAGYKLLPSEKGKTVFSAFIILLYSMMLIPISATPFIFGLTGWIAALGILICGILFAYPAFKLYFSQDDCNARKLMFSSFIYLPTVLIILFIDKLF